MLVYLLGQPETLHYARAASGAGAATFTFPSGAAASLTFTAGASHNGGMERTTIVSRGGRHTTVENNVRVSYHRNPTDGYGEVPSYFTGGREQATAVWEPEFSLGQLYNKGLFLLGYYAEVREFVVEGRAPAYGTLEEA